MAKKRTTTKASAALTKLFVLDTNVLMHDPSSLVRFQEHDIFIPMMTLEELMCILIVDLQIQHIQHTGKNMRPAIFLTQS